MASIQSAEAQILTATGVPVALRYEDAVSIVLQSRSEDAWMSYSAGGLQQNVTRIKLHADDPTRNAIMVIPFSEPRSGTIYFASSHAANVAQVVMWQF